MTSGDHLLVPCVTCGVVLGQHYGAPYSCNGFTLRTPSLPVRLACAALLDGIVLARSLTHVLKRRIR